MVLVIDHMHQLGVMHRHVTSPDSLLLVHFLLGLGTLLFSHMLKH